MTRGVLFAFNTIKKSIDLHDKMFISVIYACKYFFDSTPLGRVLNAFARHQYAIDVQLADSLMQILQYLPLTMGAMILIMAVMYETVGVFGGAILFSAIILLYVGNAEAELRNQEALSKSSIFSHLTATLEGLFSIRAYECQERFVKLYTGKLDENHKYEYAMAEGK